MHDTTKNGKSRLRATVATAAVVCALAVGTAGGIGMATAQTPEAEGGTVAGASGAVVGAPIVLTAKVARPGLCATDSRALLRRYDAYPTTMREALQQARKNTSKTARRSALKTVLSDAQAGRYGADMKAAASGKKTLAGAERAWRKLPTELHGELAAARAVKGTARDADLEAILTKAESGAFGDRMESAANAMKTRIQRCVSAVSGAASSPAPSPAPSTGTPAPSAPATTPSPSAAVTAPSPTTVA